MELYDPEETSPFAELGCEWSEKHFLIILFDKCFFQTIHMDREDFRHNRLNRDRKHL